ncbi:MAG TPA: Fic family protein [Mycobacteriales bacterium]|jgi:Fic family protein|nr:Fic family protein [Mycobacteriales bacterium]
MIFNNYLAMRRIGELRSSKLSGDLILEIHRIVTEKTLDRPEFVGSFQNSGDVRIGVYDHENNLLYQPPPAKEIQQRMKALCRFANGESEGGYLPPVLRAVTVHFMLSYVHPFEDGNGRTARALFYWSMLNQGRRSRIYSFAGKIFNAI